MNKIGVEQSLQKSGNDSAHRHPGTARGFERGQIARLVERERRCPRAVAVGGESGADREPHRLTSRGASSGQSACQTWARRIDRGREGTCGDATHNGGVTGASEWAAPGSGVKPYDTVP